MGQQHRADYALFFLHILIIILLLTNQGRERYYCDKYKMELSKARYLWFNNLEKIIDSEVGDIFLAIFIYK